MSDNCRECGSFLVFPDNGWGECPNCDRDSDSIQTRSEPDMDSLHAIAEDLCGGDDE